jgi:hypothetical protein
MFTHVIHISTDAARAACGAGIEPTMRQVLAHIESGRLIGLGKWLERLNGAAHNSKWIHRQPRDEPNSCKFVQWLALCLR